MMQLKSKIGLAALLCLMGFLHAATTTTQFTAAVNIEPPAAPFDTTVTGIQYGQILPAPGGCSTSIALNNTLSGEITGSCESYSGSSQIGVILLNNATQPVTVSAVTVSAPQKFTLSNGAGETIESTIVNQVYQTLGGASFTGCTFNPTAGPMPHSCSIYLGNIAINIPPGAPNGSYSTSVSGGVPLQVVIDYT